MRHPMRNQMLMGQVNIELLRFNPRSRDDIPAILIGLQAIYLNQELREKVLAVLSECISSNTSLKHGRPGMDLWKILVMGALRLGADLDYDRLEDLVNHHFDIRVMLMTGGFAGEQWDVEVIQDNVRLLTPEILNQINKIVVEAGHSVLKKKLVGEKHELDGRCDSFVVETNVHFPTDISLLFDAIRVILRLMYRIGRFENLEGWRQWKHLGRKMKKLVREVGALRKSIRKPKNKGENEAPNEKQLTKEKRFKELHEEILALAVMIIERATADLPKCKASKNVEKVMEFLVHANRQVDQIDRRVLKEQVIPSEEKVYSVFEPHTEWISKGKAGVPQELGVRVSLVEDQFGFILNHAVMQKQTDDKIAVPIIEETKKLFPNLRSCSFDKGYHSSSNKKELKDLLEEVTMPKKGKLSATQREEETNETFVRARHQHSAIESAINCLEHHGLDRCPDRGIEGFKRYVSLAILSRNLHQLGRIIRANLKKQSKHKSPVKLKAA